MEKTRLQQQISKYTKYELQRLCRQKHLRGYGKFNKEQLYAYCFLGHTPQLEPQLDILPQLSARAIKWESCVDSKETAQQCVFELKRRYPELVCDMSEVLAGPALAIVKNNQGTIVGAVDTGGNIVAVEPPVPPPLPSITFPPVPPPLPEVQVPDIPGAKESLMEDVEESREEGVVMSSKALIDQMRRLKGVEKTKPKAKPKGYLEDLLKKMKTYKALDPEEIEKGVTQHTIQQREARRQSLFDVESVAKTRALKTAKECPEGMAYNPFFRHCVAEEDRFMSKPACAPGDEYNYFQKKCVPYGSGSVANPAVELVDEPSGCDINMVYDPRIKMCVPVVEPDVQPLVESALDEILSEMEVMEEEDECVIS